MERFLCIHGHFYQPPRENPWLEEIEIEDSAAPYHDWNERIDAECYAPNSAARLLGPEGRIINIVDNYTRISFNFGPTLLSWMEKHAPKIYSALLESDRLSMMNYNGHGNALAQIYNHLIMPLASRKDKHTQIKWGIADFKHRFNRAPEGMWLSETAVDLETLDILAEAEITFCILAPHQARRTRKIGAQKWTELGSGLTDLNVPYRCTLPSGRNIAVFFYNGAIARDLAFGGLLSDGNQFATRLMSGFSEQRQGNQLLSVATDGESYGHHHRFGDMALAYALNRIETEGWATILNYGAFLEKNPPVQEVQIHEYTSWSCSHGVERWRADCGCNTGANPGWNQAWRAPLRMALDWLRDTIAPLFESKAGEYLFDPWEARNDYITLILDRSEVNRKAFFEKHLRQELEDYDFTLLLELMEIQRYAQLMYTSCGWFFDEISGIETVQILKYAARVIQLSEKVFQHDFEEDFRRLLKEAKSNIPRFQDGEKIYDLLVKPACITMKRIAAHYAISSLMTEYEESTNIYCYQIKKLDYVSRQLGEARFATGRISISSDILLTCEELWFSVLHLGGHIFNGGIDSSGDETAYNQLKVQLLDYFEKGVLVELLRQMDKQFGMVSYSLLDLFRDDQHRILNLFTNRFAADIEHSYRIIFENHRTLMSFSQEAGVPLPNSFLAAAEFIIACDINASFRGEKFDAVKMRSSIEEMKRWNLTLASSGLEFSVRQNAETMMQHWHENPTEIVSVDSFREMMELLRELPFDTNFWQIQNVYFEMVRNVLGELRGKEKLGDEGAANWLLSFRKIGELLSFEPSMLLG